MNCIGCTPTSSSLIPPSMPISTCKTNVDTHPSRIVLDSQSTRHTKRQIEDNRNRAEEACHRLGMRENCPHLGSLIALPSRSCLAPIPSPLALVQRVITTYLFCLGTGLDLSHCLVSGRRQEALGLRHSSRQHRHCTIMDCLLHPPTVLHHGFVIDYVSGILDSL